LKMKPVLSIVSDMDSDSYNPDDMIAALATPWGQSALAVIRITGEGSIEAAAGLVDKPEKLTKAPGYSLITVSLLHPVSGEGLDKAMAAVFRKPRSYTGQDSLELYLHGSLPGIRWVMDGLRSLGFRDASPGEFTLRAFLNRKIDLTRAEAVHEIVTSKSLKGQTLALHRLAGGIEERVREAQTSLAGVVAAAELQLDYPEEEIEVQGLREYLETVELQKKRLEALSATFKVGKIFQEGVRAAIAGRTNAGKSALFNLLLREDRSIVSDFHGTTRDYIESWITVEGIPISIFDTAGLREAKHPVEAEGIKRSEKVIGAAHIVLYVVDGTAGLSPEDEQLLSEYAGRENCIRIWNKIDLLPPPAPDGFIPLSTVTGEGFQELEQAIVHASLGKGGGTQELVIDSARQKDLLDKAAAALAQVINGIENEMPVDAVAVDLKEAMDGLGEITGEITSADILNIMFSKFCVGK